MTAEKAQGAAAGVEEQRAIFEHDGTDAPGSKPTDHQRTVELARQIMDQYDEALRELAK